MKLGPVEIRLAQRDRPARAPLSELGGTGTQVFAGLLQQQDYNADLATPALYDVYDKMRFADGQVKAALAVMKLPLLRATWSVEPASESAEDREIAEFIEDGLFGMTIPWQSFLRQALLMLDYGAMPFEEVWEMGDGRVQLRKLAPRLPRSIVQWRVDDNGGFDGIQQGAMIGGVYKLVGIPAEKLVLFVNEQEGSNWRGTSVLRAAYKHWFYKDGLYRVDAIAKERRSLGVDVGTLQGEDVDATRKADLEAAMMTLHAHEKAFFVEIENEVKYRVEGLRGSVIDPMASIEHHDLRILRSILAEFLAMGQGSTGSLAMHRDKSTFFLMALAAVGQNIVSSMNAYLIRRWVDFNWTVKEYPSLRHSRLDTRDVQALADAVLKLSQAGALTPDRKLEDEMRSLLELPALEAEGQKMEEGRRPLRPQEARVDFAALEEGLDDAERQIVRAVRAVQERQVRKLVELGETVFGKRNQRAVEDVTVPFRGEVADGVRAVLVELYDLGQREAARELTAQGARGIRLQEAEPIAQASRTTALAFLSVRARALANLMGDRLRSSFVWEMLVQIRENVFSALRLEAQLSALSDREIKKAAALSVTEALNLGRHSVAEQYRDQIDHVVFSSVLDPGTCGPCGRADGREIDIVDVLRLEALRPPYRECLGGGRCRCVFVFVLKSEEPATVR